MPAGAQQPTFIQLAPPATWQMIRSQPLPMTQLSRWGGIPAVDREYGVQKAQTDTYEFNGEKLLVIVEKASDPTAAAGLLMFYQTPGMRPVQGIALAVRSDRVALMVRGRTFLRVVSPANASPAIHSLLLQLGGPAPSPETLHLLPPSLPREGLIPGSEKYLLGPEAARYALPWLHLSLIGFQVGAEVQSAQYERQQVRLTFLIISYPTPQLAQSYLADLENQLGVNHTPSLRGRQKGTFVFLVRSRPPAPALAETLMHQMQVTESVTWDQRLPLGVPVDLQVVNLIMSNVALILILSGMAVLTGILMVVLGRMLPRWFPQSDWARQGDDSFIRLNLR